MASSSKRDLPAGFGHRKAKASYTTSTKQPLCADEPACSEPDNASSAQSSNFAFGRQNTEDAIASLQSARQLVEKPKSKKKGKESE